jgi:hypothetical protein
VRRSAGEETVAKFGGAATKTATIAARNVVTKQIIVEDVRAGRLQPIPWDIPRDNGMGIPGRFAVACPHLHHHHTHGKMCHFADA